MKPPCLLACCALLGLGLSACGPGALPDPGARTEEAQTVDLDHLRLTVRGRAELLPEAARLLVEQGQALPTLGGLPLFLQEPLRAAVADPGATLGEGTLAQDGAFTIPDIPVREIHLGLAASLWHERLAPGATLVFDTALTGTRPRTDLTDARVWALPRAFTEALTRALGEGRLLGHTEGRARTLLEAGFVLGRVVDGAGRPVSGARVRLEQGQQAHRLYYPSEDLSHLGQEGTSASGLFLYVHSGGEADTFRLSLHDARAYLWRNVGVAPGQGLVLTLFPGTFPP